MTDSQDKNAPVPHEACNALIDVSEDLGIVEGVSFERNEKVDCEMELSTIRNEEEVAGTSLIFYDAVDRKESFEGPWIVNGREEALVNDGSLSDSSWVLLQKMFSNTTPLLTEDSAEILALGGESKALQISCSESDTKNDSVKSWEDGDESVDAYEWRAGEEPFRFHPQRDSTSENSSGSCPQSCSDGDADVGQPGQAESRAILPTVKETDFCLESSRVTPETVTEKILDRSLIERLTDSPSDIALQGPSDADLHTIPKVITWRSASEKTPDDTTLFELPAAGERKFSDRPRPRSTLPRQPTYRRIFIPAAPRESSGDIFITRCDLLPALYRMPKFEDSESSSSAGADERRVPSRREPQKWPKLQKWRKRCVEACAAGTGRRFRVRAVIPATSEIQAEGTGDVSPPLSRSITRMRAFARHPFGQGPGQASDFA